MRAQDIVNKLNQRLPLLVDDFNDVFSVTSLTRSGTTVTATTSAEHGLTVGRSVTVAGAKTPISITSITRVGIVATIITAADHDITLGSVDVTEIEGATESEFNGSFTILSVPNRREIRVQVADSGPTSATGTPLLINGSSVLQSYNGYHDVTAVPTTTTFQYEITDSTLFTPASGTITAKTNPRITSAVTLERVVEAYTSQVDKSWVFVVLGDSVASKNRRLDIDATDNIFRSANFKQYITQAVALFLVSPCSSEIAARAARDRAEELIQPICQSILFAKFDSLLSAGEFGSLMFNEHGFQGYNGAVYIHRYTFELTSLISFDDTVGHDEDVAFRDITTVQAHDVGTGTITSDIDLDEEPLP